MYAEVSKKARKMLRSKVRQSPGPRAGCRGDGEWRSMSKKLLEKAKKNAAKAKQ